MKRKIIGLHILVMCFYYSFAQNTRINSYEQIGWYNFFGTWKLNSKASIHSEFQWRRADIIQNSQQNLLRLGINYQVLPKVLARIGYAHIETFAYGDIPINALGLNFTENRLFEMIQLADQIAQVKITHRWMLEQRWVERYTVTGGQIKSLFPLSNRVRYMLRLSAPFKKQQKNGFYWAAYDEVFIGFGKQVQGNIFDQNRLGLLVGKNISQHLKIEAGYLNQIIQFGRTISSKNVFQHNNGVIVNCFLEY